LKDYSIGADTLFLKISFHRILLILCEKGEMDMTHLTQESNLCRQTVYNCVEKLVNWGLVAERKTPNPPPQHFVSLTPLGNDAAATLQKIMAKGANFSWMSKKVETPLYDLLDK
jgi:predicted transcriptional regulator